MCRVGIRVFGVLGKAGEEHIDGAAGLSRDRVQVGSCGGKGGSGFSFGEWVRLDYLYLFGGVP